MYQSYHSYYSRSLSAVRGGTSKSTARAWRRASQAFLRRRESTACTASSTSVSTRCAARRMTCSRCPGLASPAPPPSRYRASTRGRSAPAPTVSRSGRHEQPRTHLVRSQRHVRAGNPFAPLLRQLRQPNEVGERLQDPFAVRGQQNADSRERRRGDQSSEPLGLLSCRFSTGTTSTQHFR